MKNVTIVYSHPNKKSFNNQILNTIYNANKNEKEINLNILDLYEEGFNPYLNDKDLELYSKGETTDEKVKKYQDIISKTDIIIFIFPIWWNSTPAMIKGFEEKVFIKDFAFKPSSKGLLPLLNHIEKGYVITTSGQSTETLKTQRGNYIQDVFIKHTLNVVGIENTKWINFDKIYRKKETQFTEFLNNIKDLI